MLSSRQLETLPNNTKVNPREYVDAIMLKSKKELNELEVKQKIEENAVEEKQSNKVQKPNEDEVILGRIHFPDNPPLYMPPIPYPQKF